MMRLVQLAAIAGLCAAASAANATVVGFSDPFTKGVARTYVVSLGPDVTVTPGVTPYINVFGHGLLGNYYENQNPDGTTTGYVDYFNDLQVNMTCTGLANCSRAVGAPFGGAGVTLDVVANGNQLTITVDDQFGSFDNCGPLNTQFCALYVSGPLYLSTGFRFDNSDPEFSYRLVSTSVPEPSTWAMIIAGFGLAGSALRRRRALA